MDTDSRRAQRDRKMGTPVSNQPETRARHGSSTKGTPMMGNNMSTNPGPH